MNSYISIAEQIVYIAEYVRRGEIALQDVPYEDIMTMVHNVYDIVMEQGGDVFVDLYTTIISKGIESENREEVYAALMILAHHMRILTFKQGKLNECEGKNFILQSRVAYLANCEKIRKWHERNGCSESVPFNGKGVIYSAIIGSYDKVKEPRYINPDFDYILFTDNPDIKSSVWQVRLVENKEGLDNVRLARKIKILGHEYLPEYDYSIWVDGKLEIVGDIREYIEQYRGMEPILCFNHYISECVCEELEICLSLKKDDPEIMKKQVARYLAEGYPRKNGMIESALLVRELKNERVRQVMETWWNEIIKESRRDQLSFNYACWKNDFVYDSTDLYIGGNKFVRVHEHN